MKTGTHTLTATTNKVAPGIFIFGEGADLESVHNLCLILKTLL
jgi:hypothetical protein